MITAIHCARNKSTRFLQVTVTDVIPICLISSMNAGGLNELRRTGNLAYFRYGRIAISFKSLVEGKLAQIYHVVLW